MSPQTGSTADCFRWGLGWLATAGEEAATAAKDAFVWSYTEWAGFIWRDGTGTSQTVQEGFGGSN